MTALASPLEAASGVADSRVPENIVGKSPLTVCFPLAGDCMGGCHVSLRGLLDQLDESQYRIMVVPELPGGILADYFSAYEQIPDPAPPAKSFEPGRNFGVGEVLRTFGSLRQRVRFLKDNGVDIVHTNDGRTHAGWALAAKLAGARLVWHHRGDPTAKGLRFVAPFLADRILTVSRFSLPRGNIGAAGSAQVVYSPFDVSIGADRKAARQRILDELGCEENTAICGYFGNFVERKRPLGFVDAVAELAKILDRPVVGVMFGQAVHAETERKLKDRIANLPGNVRVEIMGYRSPGHEWLAGCDLLLVPAIGEPLGRTLVEAMLVETPIVAADSGGNPEALSEGGGALCEPDDPADMARVARGLLDQPRKTAEMMAYARVSARDRFSEARHGQAVGEVYSAIL